MLPERALIIKFNLKRNNAIAPTRASDPPAIMRNQDAAESLKVSRNVCLSTGKFVEGVLCDLTNTLYLVPKPQSTRKKIMKTFT